MLKGSSSLRAITIIIVYAFLKLLYIWEKTCKNKEETKYKA